MLLDPSNTSFSVGMDRLTLANQPPVSDLPADISHSYPDFFDCLCAGNTARESLGQ